jgi:hypothetical protein
VLLLLWSHLSQFLKSSPAEPETFGIASPKKKEFNLGALSQKQKDTLRGEASSVLISHLVNLEALPEV